MVDEEPQTISDQPQPFHFEEIPPVTIWRYNSILGQRRKAEFQVKEHLYSLKFFLNLPDYTSRIHIRLSIGEYEVWLGLDEINRLREISEKIAPLSLQDLSVPALLAVMELALGDELSELEAVLGSPILIEEVASPSSTHQLDHLLYFVLERDDQTNWLRGHISLDDHGLEALAGRCEQFALTPNQDFHLVPIPLHIEIGQTDLNLAELEDCDAQDLVLFDRTSNFQNDIFWLRRPDGIRYRAQYEDGSLTVMETMADTPDQDPSESEHPHASQLHDLPVRLTFEVGQLDINLGDLEALNSGYTFELDQPLDRPVTIRVNGKKAGTGELLQVGERLGVRVIEFLSHDGS